MPRLVALQADRAELLAECRAAIAAMAPADPVSFGNAYERLALHFPERQMSEAEAKLVYADWRRLLGKTPAISLELAIDMFLTSPARWFPTPGQLAPFVERAMLLPRLMARRAYEVLDRIDRNDFRPGEMDEARLPETLRRTAL